MKFPPRLLVLSLALACGSCNKEDPQLLEKREQQKAEIARLKGEITLIEEKLRLLPPDVSAEVAAVTQQVEQKAAEVATLEGETATLESRKRALQKEFDAYRAKYPIP